MRIIFFPPFAALGLHLHGNPLRTYLTAEYVRAYSGKTGTEKTIKKLVELFAEKRHLPIAEQKDYVRLRLPQMLSGGHLNLWQIGDPVIALPRRVLLGIATWSVYDLKLLDSLTESLNLAHASDERVDVFDVDERIGAKAPERHFEKYIPGIGKVFNTPIVGIWENGVLSQKASGAQARKLIVDRYKLNYVTNDVLKPPDALFHDVGTCKGHWGIFVQSVVEAQNSQNLFLTTILEQSIDAEHIRVRRLELLVSASELESLPGRNRVLNQIRNWIETHEGDGFLTLVPG